MTTFLSKLRVVTLGAAHDLLDKAIDLNSPSALRQYVRDLEDALDKLRAEAATQGGLVRTITREISVLESRVSTETDLISRILSGTDANKTELARAKGAMVVQWQKELADKKQALEAQKKSVADTDAVVAKLETKHSQYVAKVRELERLDATTKIQEHSAAALEGAGKLINGGGVDVSVDDIESKMRARGDVAKERFDRAMGTVQVADDPETSAAVDDLLASLQQPQAK